MRITLGRVPVNAVVGLPPDEERICPEFRGRLAFRTRFNGVHSGMPELELLDDGSRIWLLPEVFVEAFDGDVAA